MSKRIFLGGTCNESTWRERMIHFLKKVGLEWFDPTVGDWDEKAQANELRERKKCDFCLYVITPKMTGTYSIAELIDDCHKRPHRTVFVPLRQDDGFRFNDTEWRSLINVKKMVERIGGHTETELSNAAQWMGSRR